MYQVVTTKMDDTEKSTKQAIHICYIILLLTLVIFMYQQLTTMISTTYESSFYITLYGYLFILYLVILGIVSFFSIRKIQLPKIVTVLIAIPFLIVIVGATVIHFTGSIEVLKESTDIDCYFSNHFSREYCIERKAMEQNRPDFCYKMPESYFMRCVVKSVNSSNHLTFCDEITDYRKSLCYARIAYHENDSSICDGMRESLDYNPCKEYLDDDTYLHQLV